MDRPGGTVLVIRVLVGAGLASECPSVIHQGLLMGMDLFSGDATMWWEQWRWPKLLRLAQAHGWQPLGTVQPPEAQKDYPGGRWDGNYTSNDDQTVLAEDAQALADALERALQQVPDEDALARYARPDGGIEIAPNHPPAPDADWFSGENKAHVREFIAFCRRGAFRIG